MTLRLGFGLLLAVLATVSWVAECTGPRPVVGDVRLLVIAVMNHDAVAERERFAGRNPVAAVLLRIARERAQAERVDRE